MNSSAQNGTRQPNAARHYALGPADRPWRCPMPGTSQWNSHPLVYLHPDEHGKARCPYCSAEFVLKS